jgi:ABC-2 type transport system permease protein
VSLRAVARKDLKGVTRSRAVWAVSTLLALVTALVAYSVQGERVSAVQAVQQVAGRLTLIFAILLPLVAMVAGFMAIVGERERGGIKFLLGLPNTRREVFLGKLASRFALVAGGLLFVYGTAVVVAVARHRALPLRTILGVFALTLVYAAVFVALALALSAALATRGQTIGGVVVAYVGLVVLSLVPDLRLGTLVRWIHHTMLGFETNPDLYDAVAFASPYIAYRKATNLVLPAGLQARVFERTADAADSMPVYLTDEFAVVVFAAWVVVPLALGYRRFERTDLD